MIKSSLITFKLIKMVKSFGLGHVSAYTGTVARFDVTVKKTPVAWHSSFIIICLLLASFFPSGKALGQNTSYYCSGNCTSGDIRITKVEIVNLNGGALPAYCDQDVPVKVKLKFHFNVTSQTRYGFLVSGDLWIDGEYVKGVVDCSGDTYRQGAREFLTTITLDWTCGSTIELKNVFTAWDNAAPSKSNSSICDRRNTDGTLNCSLITPKCYYYGNEGQNGITVVTPVSSSFNVQPAQCSSSILYAPITFTAAGSGGTPPYSYTWYVRDSVTHTDLTTSTDNPFTYNPTGPNNLSVKVVITDNSPTSIKKDSVTKLVTVTSCCTSPSIASQQHPINQLKCEGGTATFTVGYTAGSPSTAIQWQEKIGGGDFTNISNSSNATAVPNYSGANAPTLTITGVTAAMNNRQYRAVLSSGACAPATSNAATLNVDIASVGGTTAADNSPICSGTGTTVSLSNNTGSIQKWQYSTDNGTTWSDISSNSTSISTGNLTNTTQYRAVVKNGVCDAITSSPVTVTVDAISLGGATAATSSPICSGTGTTITLSGHRGAIQKWQSSTNGTDWTNIISTDNPFNTGNLEATTQFRAVVKSGVCSIANSAPVTVTVDAPPSTATAGTTQEHCGTLVSTSLGGNTPSTGSGTWTKKEGPGTVSFSAANEGNSTATVSMAGTYVFTWTITNGSCPSSSADIAVKYYTRPSDPAGNVTPPTCTNANGTVTISSPLDGESIDYEYRNGAGDWTDNVSFTIAAGTAYSIAVRNKVTRCLSTNTYAGTMPAQPSTPALPAFSKTNATCSAGGSITITNYNASYTYVLTGPSPATTNRTITAALTQNIAAGDYSLTAGLTTNGVTCTSQSVNISIDAAAGIPTTPVMSVKQYATCSSAAMIIEATGPTPLSDYQFRNGANGTWQNSNEFTITAGSGYEIYARRKSDNSCVSLAQTCTTEEVLTQANKPVNEEVGSENQKSTGIIAKISSSTKVLAAPNPFTDRVRFSLQSDVSGQGSLEIFNTLGQKIHTVYQGHVEAGKPLTKEYVVPRAQRANLIYVFRVGDQKTTGKLLNR